MTEDKADKGQWHGGKGSVQKDHDHNKYSDNWDKIFGKDKGLSVGEKSFAEINNLNIKNTNLAIAIKDSSVTFVSNFTGENINSCINAYRKKQEFGPVRIKIEQRDCYGTIEDFIQEGSMYIEK